jgi:hypothetical protein
MGRLLHKQNNLAIAESIETAVKREFIRTKIQTFNDPKQELVSYISSEISKLFPHHDRCADMNAEHTKEIGQPRRRHISTH